MKNQTENKNFIFKQYSKIFTSPEKWNIISTLFKTDSIQNNDTQLKEWHLNNSETHLTKELLFILKGSTYNSLEDRVYPATPGTIFLFDSYEKHDRFYSPDTNNAIHLWIFFLKKEVIVRMHHIHKGVFNNARDKGIIISNNSVCNLFIQEWKKLKKSLLPEELKKDKIKILLNLLFIELIERDIHNGSFNSNTDNYQTEVISSIYNHIISTAGKDMSVAKLAKIAGYSKFHFFRIFKKHTGENVHDCINKARLKKVNKMIKNNYLYKEISEELGFSCPAAFSSWYKKQKIN